MTPSPLAVMGIGLLAAGSMFDDPNEMKIVVVLAGVVGVLAKIIMTIIDKKFGRGADQAEQSRQCEKDHASLDGKFDRLIDKQEGTNRLLERIATLLELKS